MTSTTAAGADDRLKSWVIDGIVILAMALAVGRIAPGVFGAVVFTASSFAYTVWLPAAGHPRLGHRVLGLVVVDATDRPAGGAVLAARAVLMVLFALPCLGGVVLSGLTMRAHPAARAWHDVATGTLVRRRGTQSGERSS